MSTLNSGFYSQSSDEMPVQTIPLKDKLADGVGGEKSFKERCMDSLESIGRRQYAYNMRLIENYEMIKGRFIFNHYFHTTGYSSMIDKLSSEFELPNYLRHYDIIGQVVNKLVSEWLQKPDMFRSQQLGDGAANEYMRKKMELTSQYALNRINAEINNKLLERGIDINKSDFSSQEEQQQYQQQVGQMRQQMTPQEIQKYMDTDFMTNAEIWAQHQYELDKKMFNTAQKEKVEITDMFVANQAYRHFYIGVSGHMQETWNPINVFGQKSPDIQNAEDGDYVGRIFNLSLNTIIDRYGHRMKKKDFDLLIEGKEKDKTKWKDSKFDWVFDDYMVPFKGYPTYDIMKASWNTYADGEIPFLTNDQYQISTDSSYANANYYFVTEGYWKTQKQIIKLTYQDPETGELIVDIVDENFVLPKTFSESVEVFSSSHDINTYCKTYVNEVWKGIKINFRGNNNIGKDLYLSVGPNDFQFKGDLNIYGCKLPVCGGHFDIRNSKSVSLVDMMKPHQIGHNVAMNQLYQLAEKEIGMFVVMDVNMFPSQKDWGGEDAWGKWMLMAKNLGLLPADTSPSNLKGSLAATGGFLPKVLDLNLASQMVSRINMAKFYEEQALKQVGFNGYRTGSFNENSTATGIQQGLAQSYNQTDIYTINFSNYIRRCNQMNLDIAQFVQSQKEDITITYIKSDLNRAFIKILGANLLLSELGVIIDNSQDENRKLEMMRQYALQNNTSVLTPVDVADVIMMNSPAEIRRQLESSYTKILAQQQQAQEAQQEQAKAENDLEVEKQSDDNTNKQLDRENKLNIEYLQAGKDIINSPTTDTNDSNMKQADTQNRIQNAQNDISLKASKLDLERQRTAATIVLDREKLANDRRRIQADLQIQHEETQTARIMKGLKK